MTARALASSDQPQFFRRVVLSELWFHLEVRRRLHILRGMEPTPLAPAVAVGQPGQAHVGKDPLVEPPSLFFHWLLVPLPRRKNGATTIISAASAPSRDGAPVAFCGDVPAGLRRIPVVMTVVPVVVMAMVVMATVVVMMMMSVMMELAVAPMVMVLAVVVVVVMAFHSLGNPEFLRDGVVEVMRPPPGVLRPHCAPRPLRMARTPLEAGSHPLRTVPT